MDFRPDRSIRLAVHGPKVGHSALDCASVFKLGQNVTGCYSYVTERNGFGTATKLGTTQQIFVAAIKNFVAATKRFVDRTKHSVVITKCFCYPYFNK